MITQVLKVMRSGWQALITHRSLLLVVLLGLLIPVLFVVVAIVIFTTAKENITTIEKTRISALHDMIELQLKGRGAGDTSTHELLSTFAANQTDISHLSVGQALPGNNLYTLAALDQTLVGRVSSTTNLERTALTQLGQSFIFELTSKEGDRLWRVHRAVELVPGITYYISSEHNFKTTDHLLESRIHATYLLLGIIVLTLLVFIYFMTKQVDYKSKYALSVSREREQDVFMGAVVHELRAPLTAMRGYASLIEESNEASPNLKKNAEHISTAATRLVALIGDYLTVIKLRTGADIVPLEEVPVLTTTKAVVNELMPSAHEKQLELTVLSQLGEVTVVSNQKFLSQILTNLVSNAIKYTEKGTIEIVIESVRNAIEIRIKDTGYGMSAEDQDKLFAPFARVGDGVQMQSITGSGLGMWLTKLMTEKLGGSVNVESIKGVGTHVVLRFKK